MAVLILNVQGYLNEKIYFKKASIYVKISIKIMKCK